MANSIACNRFILGSDMFKLFAYPNQLYGGLFRMNGLLIIIGLLLIPQLLQASVSLAEQRENFAAAERAFAAGRLADYRSLAKGLADYPLYPYLRYNRLRRNISPAKYAEIEQFLQEYSALPLAGYLRNRWLHELARTHAWQQYAEVYRPTRSVALQCNYYRALLIAGTKEQAWQGARDLWLHGRSQPKACDPLFSAWKKSSDFSTELVWRRFQLALSAGQTQLAGYLAKLLPIGEQVIAKRMIAVHRKPATTLDCDLWQQPEFAMVAAHGVRRLARRDAAAALAIWQARAGHTSFDPADRISTLNRLALEVSLAGAANAEEFLDELPEQVLDDKVSEWRLRWALGKGEWELVLSWYEQLPELPKESTRWRYWRARALQAKGDDLQANSILTELATQRDYYGFLAADQLELPYQFLDKEDAVESAVLTALANQPAIRRVAELRHFDRETEARREWWYRLNGENKERRVEAAKLAQQWGWHPLDVLTVASAKSWNDLELRFPRLFSEIIAGQAETQQLPEELIFGLIRRESIFDPNARSPVGARGLMQLMPATAKKVARSRREPWHSVAELSRPDLNIRYGSDYLRQMLNRFDDHNVLALAAYNGGPHNVNRWLRKRSAAPADLWTELITYGETREYVQAVLSTSRQRWGQPWGWLRRRFRWKLMGRFHKKLFAGAPNETDKFTVRFGIPPCLVCYSGGFTKAVVTVKPPEQSPEKQQW